MLRKLNENAPFFEDDPQGGGGGGGRKSVEEERAQIRKELEQEYAGLRTNRDEVLAEKRQLKEKLVAIEAVIEAAGGSDGIKALQELKTRLEKDEIGKLLTEGKHEEWFEKRTGRMRSEHQQQVESLMEQLEAEKKGRGAAEKARTDLMLETAVRAASGKMGVIDSAVSDVILRARGVFSFDQERDALVIRDEKDGAVLGKDGKNPMSVDEWLESQKESARHWFPPSKGSGAQGAHGNGAGEPDPSKMSWADYAKWREEKGMSRPKGIPG
jgi:hypothetical protein